VVERPSEPLRLYLGAYAQRSAFEGFEYIMRAPLDRFIAEREARAKRGWQLVSIEVQRDPTSWGAALKKVYGDRAVGYSFAVGDGRTVTEQGSHGWAIRPDPGSSPASVAMSADTSLTLGSVSKTLGAVTVLQMIESGQYAGLSLGASVFDLLNGHHGIEASILKDQRVRGVTLQQMLTMTSGLQESTVPGDQLDPDVFWSYIRAYLSQELDPVWLGPDGKPGQVFSYSNSAYITLRGIIEVLAGVPYETKEQEVLNLAGLSSARTRLPIVGQGYPVRYYDSNRLPPAGNTIADEASWLSSAVDMIRLLQAFRPPNGAFQAIYETMAAPHPVPYQLRRDAQGKWERYSAPVNTFVGLDALGGDPAPTFRAKNGTYTNLSSAEILILQDPALDIVYQSNTDSVFPPDVLFNQSVFGV
jgi:CubicO group peptidase (beta-lactamase class C family)